MTMERMVDLSDIFTVKLEKAITNKMGTFLLRRYLYDLFENSNSILLIANMYGIPQNIISFVAV